ncbi:DUF4421 family protein [Dysgonomonas sp. 25]|uniref:DUF4421 family protein n=1 Tax=Dysgonomonas sp. 25 TaxID=2302933 RepID=UPI0013CF5225|nr:DUF4421 family protein [Dysgonomonas sp. 25]NDV69178.1 DUF4421 domain-containing protein [Dysgonomonas sp. 25]
MPRSAILSIFAGALLFLVQTNVAAQVDSSYVERYNHPLSIKVYTQYKFMELEHQYGKIEDSFNSNNPMSVGVGITWKKVSVSGSVSISPLRDKKRGKTKSFDFQHHYYGQKFVSDIFVQHYEGFYQKDDETNDVLAICPDINVTRYGGSGQYIFNNKRFSYTAAFNNNARQIRSAGSFHLGGNVFYTRITSDSSLVYKDNYKQKNLQVGIVGGYTHSWFIKRWYITASLTAGVNLGTDNISEFYRSKVNVYPSVLPRIAAGYYGDDWTVSVSGVFYNSSLIKTKEDKLNLSSGLVQLSFTKRLDFKSKFLDKITFQ